MTGKEIQQLRERTYVSLAEVHAAVGECTASVGLGYHEQWTHHPQYLLGLLESKAKTAKEIAVESP